MSNYIQAIPLQSMTIATLVDPSLWYVFDASGIPEACAFIRFINVSDTNVFVSYDGITDADYIPADSTVELNFQENALIKPGSVALLKKGTKIYLQGTAGPKGGTVYLAGYFQD